MTYPMDLMDALLLLLFPSIHLITSGRNVCERGNFMWLQENDYDDEILQVYSQKRRHPRRLHFPFAFFHQKGIEDG